MATSPYSGARVSSMVRSIARGLTPRIGRSRERPTRLAAEAQVDVEPDDRAAAAAVGDQQLAGRGAGDRTAAERQDAVVLGERAGDRLLLERAEVRLALVTNRSATLLPVATSMSWSVSRKATPSGPASAVPTVVLPDAGGPTRTSSGRLVTGCGSASR